MATATTYDPARTALLLVDPYNDFLSEGGKLWPRVREVVEKVGVLDNLRSVVTAVRAAGLTVVFVPHRQWEEGDYAGWDHPYPGQAVVEELHTFARGSWGGQFHPDFQVQPGDIRIAEHWAQSGFANTDLDMRLKQRGITHVVLVGMLANSCVESTGRFAMELGYHVTLVRDATAAYSMDRMHAAHELNGPTFAHSILTASQLLSMLPAIDQRR